MLHLHYMYKKLMNSGFLLPFSILPFI